MDVTAHDKSVARRAVEAVIWGIPYVNYRLRAAAAEQAGASANQIVFWSRLFDWRNQTLTPNSDVVYLMPFIDTTTTGPMVLEIPAAVGGAINGSVMDAWQAPSANVEQLKKHFVQFLALATGGPAHYEGKEITSTHAGMRVTNPEFDAAVGDLKASLDRLKIPNTEQKELLAIVESTRPQIVTVR